MNTQKTQFHRFRKRRNCHLLASYKYVSRELFTYG